MLTHEASEEDRVDTTNSPAPPPASPPPAVTPSRTENNRSRNYERTLTSSPAQSLWTALSGKRSREPSTSPPASPPARPDLAPQLVFETPSSGPANSVKEDAASIDANTYYTASWGSPYQRVSRDAVAGPSARLIAELARDRPLDSDSPTASPPFGLDYLVPSRVPVHSRDVTPSFGLDHLIPTRVPVQPHISNPVSSDRLASQRDQSEASSSQDLLKPVPVRHQVTRSLTEDWVHQYTSGRWRSERGNWLSDESAEDSDSSSEKSEDFKTPIPFTWFAGRHRRRNSTSVDSPELTRIGIKRPTSKRSNTDGPVFDTFAFRKHKSRKSNLTLKQEDFWKLARELDPTSEGNMSLFESRWAAEPVKEFFKKVGVREELGDQSDDKLDDSLEEGEIPAELIDQDITPTADMFQLQLQRQQQQQQQQQQQPPPEAEQTTRIEKPLPPTPPEDAKTTEDAEEQREVPPPPISKTATPPPPMRQRTRLLWKGKACWIGLPQSGPEAYGRVKPLSPHEVEARVRRFEEAGYNTRGFDVDDHWAGSAISQSRAVFPDPNEDAELRQKKAYKVMVPNPKAWKEYMDQQIEAKLAALGVSFGDEPAAPAPPTLSRQSSGHFPGQSISPNMAASMNGSHRSTPSLAHFSTAAHSHSASMASPLSMPGAPGHLHRHSVFGMPYGFPQHQTAHSGLPAFSPGQHFNMNGVARGGSPALDRLRSDSVGPVKSPMSPFGNPSPHGLSRSPKPYPPDMGQVPPHLRHQSVYSSFSPQPQLAVTPTLRPQPALPELREDEEEQAQDYFSGIRPDSQHTEIIHPSPRGHRHNISEGLEREIQEAEYHLERSIERQMEDESTADDSFNSSTRSRPGQDQHTYVPPAKRAILNMNGHIEQSPSPQPQMDGIASAGFAAPLQNKLLGKTKGHASKLSVAAPEFKFNPGGAFQPAFTLPQHHSFAPPQQNSFALPQQNSFNPAASGGMGQSFSGPAFGGFGGSTLPTSDFNFSTTRQQLPTPTTVQQPPQTQLPTIFGNVTIPEVVKPARRSKALPIKAPVIREEAEPTEKEDENGRVMQSNTKKARTLRRDGDDVPRFAERPPDPPKHLELPPRDVPEELKLGSSPEAEPIAPAIPPVPVLPAVPEKQDVKSASPLTQANLEQSLEHGKTTPQQGHKKNTSSLSALAKPFEFKLGGGSGDFKPANGPKFVPQEQARMRSPSALQDKPDFSPARVFSRNLDSLNHKAVESLSYNTSPEPQKHAAPYPQDEPENVQYPEPTFDEIDAVMQQLNDDDNSEQSITFATQMIREGTPNLESSVIHHSMPKNMRSDAPSPSPRRPEYHMGALSRSPSPQEDRFPSEEFQMPSGPSINRLNRDDDVPLSEWSDDLDVTADRIQTRSRFFDNRIDSIVGNILADQLRPLEQAMQQIHRAVSTKISRPRSRPATARTGSAVESDADDEDDLPSGAPQYRPVSSGKDKRVADSVKAAVLEAFHIQEMNNAHSSSGRNPGTPGLSSAVEIHHALMDMNTTIARIAGANIDLDDVRAVVEDALHRNSQALIPVVSGPLESRDNERNHKRAITELEGRFTEALVGKLEEANQRRMIEEREAETKKLLRLAEEELSLLRETTSDQDQRIHSLQREFQTSLGRAEEAETEKRNLEKQLADVEQENTAFESTLEEYRLSSSKWRQEVDDLSSENESLKSIVGELKAQIADGLNIRENMRGKLDKIHSDMAGAAEQLANEKSAWQTRNEDLQRKSIILQARLDGEISVRRNLEEEVHSLRSQVHDGITAKIHLEQALRSNASHQEAVSTLKTDLAAEQTLVARLERDLHEAKESGRTEVQRTQMIMESSIEATNSQASIIRASLEHELHLAHNEIDHMKMTADTAKARFEMLLEEEGDLRRDALRKVNETSSSSLNDLREKHQEALRHMQLQHERDVTNTLQDKQRSESYLNDRLSLSNDQVKHLKERVSHLEERLQVANSAAQAAAKQAQTARNPSLAPVRTPAPALSNVLEPTRSHTSEDNLKISPQALRESILVLQEQLQERETRIESLQFEINSLDTSAPGKLKERDTEITWLRELLAVRNEDLSELIRQLEKDGFDREAVRDYAIRIRAGIQMEQAEKERLISAGTSKAALAVAGLVNAASPGAARLASAWGNWRKGRSDSTSSNSAPVAAMKAPTPRESSRGKAPSRPSHQPRPQQQTQHLQQSARISSPLSRVTATPSKPTASPNSSIFAGLMTPPASNLRRSPTPTESALAPGGAELKDGGADAMPSWQQGTVDHSFTQAAPPGFGPSSGSRRSSPLSQDGATPDVEMGTQTGLFSGGYDSDAELGAELPPTNFDDEDEDDVHDADGGIVESEIARLSSIRPASHGSGDVDNDERGQVLQEQPLDMGFGDERRDDEEEEEEMGIAEETLGRSLAAELESL